MLLMLVILVNNDQMYKISKYVKNQLLLFQMTFTTISSKYSAVNPSSRLVLKSEEADLEVYTLL